MKNMKIPILLLFLLYTILGNSQELQKLYVAYDIFFNTDYPVQKKCILQCSNEVAHFITYLNPKNNSSNETEEGPVVTQGKDNEVIIQLKEIDKVNFTDLKAAKIISTESKSDINYRIEEAFPTMHWTISEEETRLINQYRCNKALLTFRGRKYTAWFTTDIPMAFGPWKFHGLPGLILEIYDEDNRYHWSATRIQYPYTSDKPISLLKPERKGYQNITLTDYVILADKLQNQANDKILAQLPRGYTGRQLTIARHGLELQYEWEDAAKGFSEK
ncbi:hypothetical protein FK004_03285 [Flavobacterium kingsejongi]|uniref:GLPGLI family protein n=2 Tax=Flavobacterium kingsejongi TaxID=1678728 RepID=A0A2S1LKR1_9FLAO|nr:hypothetical protein FK004_03285 [Flavobacterium kingsejongi]